MRAVFVCYAGVSLPVKTWALKYLLDSLPRPSLVSRWPNGDRAPFILICSADGREYIKGRKQLLAQIRTCVAQYLELRAQNGVSVLLSWGKDSQPNFEVSALPSLACCAHSLPTANPCRNGHLTRYYVPTRCNRDISVAGLLTFLRLTARLSQCPGGMGVQSW